MKKYLFLLLLLTIVSATSSQVHTPNGSLVQDTNVENESLTSADIAYIVQRLAIEYPHAIALSSPTATYNCHAYAWHMSEGGNAVWMGSTTNPTSIYWTDGSYIQTTEKGNGIKVSYANGNHSAVTTDQQDIFISKWGSWPLIKHEKDYCPYISNNLKYYMRAPSISGPSHICGQGTYTIQPFPTGATVVWSQSEYMQQVSGSGATKIFRGTNKTKGWIEATVNGITLRRFPIWCGEPSDSVQILIPEASNPTTSNICKGVTMLLGVAPYHNNDDRVTGYVWDFGSWKPYVLGYLDNPANGRTNAMVRIHLPYDAPSVQAISVMPINACSPDIEDDLVLPSGGGGTFYAVNCGKSSAPSAVAYPNPASTLLTVEVLDDFDREDLSSEASRSSSALNFEIRLYDNKGYLVRQIVTKDRTTQINISDLPNGNYFLHIYEDGNDKPDIHQIIIAH